MSSSRVSIGVAGALGPAVIGPLAAVVERAGFGALWVNDTPGGDALVALSAAAAQTSTLVLATGVIPVDRRPAPEIAAAVRAAALPAARTVVGIGSGRLRHGALEAVGAAADLLRGETGARVVVGALGPRMRELAATRADGVVLSWLTPAAAAEQASAIHALDPDARVVLYARTALAPAAVVLRDEEARAYAGYPAYAAHFARLGIDPLDTVLPHGGEPLAAGADAYLAGVDDLVLRAITSGDDLDAKTGFVEEAAGLLG